MPIAAKRLHLVVFAPKKRSWGGGGEARLGYWLNWFRAEQRLSTGGNPKLGEGVARWEREFWGEKCTCKGTKEPGGLR